MQRYLVHLFLGGRTWGGRWGFKLGEGRLRMRFSVTLFILFLFGLQSHSSLYSLEYSRLLFSSSYYY